MIILLSLSIFNLNQSLFLKAICFEIYGDILNDILPRCHFSKTDKVYELIQVNVFILLISLFHMLISSVKGSKMRTAEGGGEYDRKSVLSKEVCILTVSLLLSVHPPLSLCMYATMCIGKIFSVYGKSLPVQDLSCKFDITHVCYSLITVWVCA